MTPDKICFRPEQVDASAWIASTAVVLGDVSIGAQSTIWYHAVLRGDTDTIRVGRETNVQDGCILHADPGFPCTLGDRVTVGHGAIVHGASVADDCLIGMRAVVMNGAKIGSGSIVGVGAIVMEGHEIPPESVAIGVPARVARQTTPRDRERIAHAALHYVKAGKVYRGGADAGAG
jgi:carbonic anhydrase/acetyltransferase-like protein (isoleucine patch superfamily)